MVDQRTMAELLCAPTEGYAKAIVVPPILAEQFKLKHSLINMMTSDQFFGLEKDNPHDHNRAARRWLEKEPPRSILTWEDLAWDRYKDLLCACPHHGFTELHQLDTFYNALNPADQDSLNSAAGGNLLERRTQDVLAIIKNKSKVRNSRKKSIVSQVKSSDGNSSSSSEIAKLTHAVNQQTSAVTTATTAILKQFQATSPPAFVKAVEEIYVTCGGAHPYYQCLAADGNTFLEFWDNIQGYLSAAAVNYNQGNFGYRPSSVANQIRQSGFGQLNVQNNQNWCSQPQGYNRGNNFNQDTSYQALIQQNRVVPSSKLKSITTRSGLVLDGPSVPMPHPFINPEEDERAEETLTDPELAEYTIKVPPPLMFKQLHINITLADALILILKYQKMLKALLSNKEKLLELENTPLNENCSAVILKKLPEKLGDPGKFLIPCGFSELKCKALADLGAIINLMPLSVWKKLGLLELISTHMTLELANWAICTPAGIARDVFVLVGKFTFPVNFVIVDYESDPRVPLILGIPFLQTARALIDDYLKDLFATNHLSGNPTFYSHTDLTSLEVINPLSGTTTSSSSDHLLEDFVDELALITFPPRNDDLPFNIESDHREIEYLLNHNPTKEMDSILEDSVDECNLADPNNNLVDTILEMFTVEHTLDYSSPPLYEDVDDDLFKLESDNDDVYDDPFDSKEDKIKESIILIDELDPPRSSDFLPSPECHSILYEDFSEVDALPSTNNKDKVFNLGILIHENLFEVTIQVTPDKNVKKISLSNASLILELPFMNFLSTKKFPSPKLYSCFYLKIRKKFSTPGFSLLKEFILLFSRNYLIGALKLSKSFKFLKARWRFFLALMERTSVFWMFRVSISIPHEQLNSGLGHAE
uniref:Reverse transcriptase domain-containing protein n=1 Tax=Tanacetum cinerariifolium TaxID=118510 RepID=A0A699GK58_TANCI|nr:reverse transcriptase domain-containing protein [Tanacetum cinerariifolium]